MTASKSTSGEDIGRPGPWGEGRYQQEGQPADQSVRTPAGEVPEADPRPSAPVTQKDYEQPGESARGKGKRDEPGGDAG